MKSLALGLVPGSLLLVAGLSAQGLPESIQSDLQPATSALPRVPIHTAAPEGVTAYGTWAAGDAYKCSFHDGMTFVPYLGDYPQNQPWSWRTTSVRAGEVELLAANEDGPLPAAHWHDEWRYEYRMGAFTEAYDVLHEGLEQTFVVTQLPAAGDLVVRGAVTSDLSTRDAAAAQQELTFADRDGLAILRYGQALAFDAAGNTTPVTTAFAGGEITLTVPGAWLAHATLPVTVDPLLTPAIVGSALAKITDIGHDDRATTKNVMYAITMRVSNFDDDVRAYLSDHDHTNSNSVFADITSGWDSDDASCAFVGGTDRWVIALRRYFPTWGIRRSHLRAHLHDSADPQFLTNVIYMSTPTGHNDWRPDVGGVEGNASGNNALVVFQREDNAISPYTGNFRDTDTSATWAVLLETASPSGSFGTPTRYLSGPSQDAERPSVQPMAEGGSQFFWVVGAQHYASFLPDDDWDVFVARIDQSGNLLPGYWKPEMHAADTHHQLGVQLDGQDGRYLACYSTVQRPTTPAKYGNVRGERLCVERFDWSQSSSATPVTYPMVEIETASTPVFEPGGVAFDSNDRSHFAIGYRDMTATLRAVKYARVGYTGNVTEGPALLFAAAGMTPSNASCIYIGDLRRFAFCYSAPLATPRIYGRSLADAPAPPVSATGFGCSPATISWSGRRQIGSEFETIRIQGAGNGAGNFMLVSLASADQLMIYPGVASGCRLLVDNGPAFLGTMPFRAGNNASWRFPLPEWLPTTTLYFQDWILSGHSFESSRRLAVTVVK